ncbi:MAG: T9SS type A sorting domain-containing protein [Salinivirgaceae bacterium]
MRRINTFLLLFLSATIAQAQTIIADGEEINGHFTIEASPYTIEGKAFVAENDTLVIDAGVEIQLAASISNTDSDFTYSTLSVGMIRVHGTLMVNGTEEQAVIFTRVGDEGKWGVILFDETATDACKIEHARIEHAGIVRAVVGTNDFPGAVSFYKNNATIKNSTLINNGKDFGSYSLGCGVVSYNATPTITNNIIDQSLEYGIWCISDYGQETTPIITNNLITNNKEGINLVISNGLIANNTIANNIDFGINMMLANPTIVNTIFYNNGAVANSESTGTISHSLLDEAAIPGDMSDNGGNFLNGNPEFLNESTYQLAETSPCINAGTTDTTNLFLPQTDLSGNLRIMGDTIDMGAFEFFTDDTRINEQDQPQKLVVYPNPANNFFRIEGLSINCTIEIYTITGKIVKTINYKNNQLINISNLPSGIFMIKIDTKKQSSMLRLIK